MQPIKADNALIFALRAFFTSNVRTIVKIADYAVRLLKTFQI